MLIGLDAVVGRETKFFQGQTFFRAKLYLLIIQASTLYVRDLNEALRNHEQFGFGSRATVEKDGRWIDNCQSEGIDLDTRRAGNSG